MAKTDKIVELREALESALTARADELRAEPEAFSMPAIRRLLEEDAKLEPHYLDEHKGLVKDLLSKVFCEDDSGEEEAADQQMEETGVEEVEEVEETSRKDESVENQVETGEKKVLARKEEKRAPLTDQIVEAAVAKRASYVRDNAETLTMSGFRRLLEGDLKLAEKKLDSFKSLIKRLVDEALVEEVPPVTTKKATKEAAAAYVRKRKKGEDVDSRSATGKKRDFELVKSKAVKKPVKRGRVASSDDGEESEEERDERKTAVSRQAKGKARKRAVESDKSADSSDESGAEDRKENRQKRAKLVAEKGSNRARKPAADRNSVSGSEEDVGDERSGSRKNQKAKPKTKCSEREDSEEGAESDGGSKKSQGRKAVYEPKPVYSKQVERLRSLIKACGMNVSPSIYKKAKNAPEGKQEAVLLKELESLLEREGLTPQATEKEIKAVRRKKDKMKDLEGIDSSNIISEPRGRRSASASFFAPKYSQIKSDDDSDDRANGNDSANDDVDEADDDDDAGSSGEEEEIEEEEDAGEEDAESDGRGGDESD